ncbi:hypothetical protein DUI87_25730 [Hirundo rustica rustica]|uniref:Reverse transcriptase domain-containing protein n=1 Tax=Hirundo rustica rustica TaxID=333673 RepID=A0A3M0J954_HIRRU|nr:hypothetical protein DUI87_25730 [Hirundo rustica rustica]
MACPQDKCPPDLVDGVREQNGPPVIQEEAVRELLSCLDVQKSMGPDGIHPKVMRELADEPAKLLSIIYQQSWLTGEVPGDRKLANVTPFTRRVGRRILILKYFFDTPEAISVMATINSISAAPATGLCLTAANVACVDLILLDLVLRQWECLYPMGKVIYDH